VIFAIILHSHGVFNQIRSAKNLFFRAAATFPVGLATAKSNVIRLPLGCLKYGVDRELSEVILFGG